MPRSLDEVIKEQSTYAQTPIPPVSTYATPGWDPSMGMTRTPTQTELIRQATPTMLPPMMNLSTNNAHNMALSMGSTPMGYSVVPPPPPPSPMAHILGNAAQYMNPGVGSTGAALAASQGFLDPNNALQNLGHIKAQEFGRSLGSGISNVGTGTAFLPGGQALGLGMSLGGGFLGDMASKIPGVEWVNRQMYGSAATDLSNMAQLQHGTAGMMNLTGTSAGLGGTGMSTTGALKLGQRYRSMAEQWGMKNTELAEQMGGGDSQIGMQRYTQDLTKLTQMAGDSGLLDAATNIDQVGDTVTKLFKVLGTMGKITGDPDFRNNLREIANMRQQGFTIDQAVNATRDIQRYARGAGITREEMMATGGAMGAQTFGSYGLAGGVGMVYGAQAQLQARQLGGAYTPMQEALLGGREGISQRWAQQQAQFATGPMNMMMGAAMTGGPGGVLSLDANKMNQMLAGGTTLSGMAGQSQGNLMGIARQMAQQQGRPVQDVLVELMQRQPELQSQMANQLGPEGMRMLQMRTVASLSRPGSEGGMGLGLHTAAQLVAGGDPRQAQMLTGMMTSPEFYERAKEDLGRRLASLRGEAKQERLTAREAREELRAQHTTWGKIKGAFGAYDDDERPSGWYARINAKQAEETARELAEQEDAARGVRRVHLGRTIQVSSRAAEEEASRLKETEGLDLGAGSGIGQFERLRRMQERGFKSGILRGTMAGASMDQIELAQEASGEGGFLDRMVIQGDRGISSVGAFFTGDDIDTKTIGSVGQTRRVIDQTLEMASAIEKGQKATLSDLASEMKVNRKRLQSAGIKAGGMNQIENAISRYAERVGRGEEGTAMSKAGMRKSIVKALKELNVPERQISKMVSDKSMNYWMRYGTKYVSELGTEEGKAGLSETTDIAEKFFSGTVDEMKERFSAFQEDYEEGLADAGITKADWLSDSLTDEEKIAMESLQNVESDAEREAMVLMGVMRGGEDEGITSEMREQAESRLKELTMNETEVFQKARSRMKKLEEQGGIEAVQTVGKTAKLQQMYAGGLGGLRGEMAKGYREGKGFYGAMGKMKKATGEAVAMGGSIKDGALDLPTETGVGSSVEETMRGVEGQISALDEMKKQFAGFGRSAKTLEIAAQTQIKAAEALGGDKVRTLLNQYQKDLEN